jgi:hypothetical protein
VEADACIEVSAEGLLERASRMVVGVDAGDSPTTAVDIERMNVGLMTEPVVGIAVAPPDPGRPTPSTTGRVVAGAATATEAAVDALAGAASERRRG